MEPKDLVRAPIGTVAWYEVERHTRGTKASRIQSYCARAGAKVKFQSINGFDSYNQPVYLLRAEVVKQGAPRKRLARR